MTEETATLSLARQHPKRGRVINLLLFVALILFFVGIFMSIMTVQKFFIFNNTVSIVTGLIDLLKEGEALLFIIIFAFSIVLPLIKMGVIYWIWNHRPADSRERQQQIKWIEQYGKWSMLDVFVVAILVVSVKLEGMAEVQVHMALYAFAISVLLTMFVATKVIKVVEDE